MAAESIDVLVVGAGPSGAALAIDLVRRGLRVRIIDKATHAFAGSRAKGVQPRTLEVLEDLGALEDVLAGGGAYPPLGIHAGPLTVPWRMIANRKPSADIPFPNTWLIPQERTDGALHARLHAWRTNVEFGTELLALTAGEQSVNATVRNAEGIEHIEARYVAAADGGSSNVRRQLGISFNGSTDEEDRMVIADAVVTGLSRDRWHIWPERRGRFMGACPLPHSDLFQWMIRLAPGEEPGLDKAALTKRIRAHTGNTRIELHDIHWASVFRPNIRLADHYRVGRVFLLGDAAHVHTPAGAQGLNTGIQDAYNLGWKLAQVLSGAPDRLLDTYEAERLPVAAFVLGLSTAKYDALAKPSPSSIRRGSKEQQLAISYRGGPLAPRTTQPSRTLHVGDRAPDAALIDVDGRATRLYHAFCGPHFSAVAYGSRAASALARMHWTSAGAGLTRVFIDSKSTGKGGASAPFAEALTDRAHTFRRAYGVSGDALFLVRPDGYIGHIATGDALETHSGAVAAMTPMVA
jgi:2-polyprenyl-6-methoxyphenol hydroxylase-like FAD-dependent oxidoreductase